MLLGGGGSDNGEGARAEVEEEEEEGPRADSTAGKPETTSLGALPHTRLVMLGARASPAPAADVLLVWEVVVWLVALDAWVELASGSPHASSIHSVGIEPCVMDREEASRGDVSSCRRKLEAVMADACEFVLQLQIYNKRVHMLIPLKRGMRGMHMLTWKLLLDRSTTPPCSTGAAQLASSVPVRRFPDRLKLGAMPVVATGWGNAGSVPRAGQRAAGGGEQRGSDGIRCAREKPSHGCGFLGRPRILRRKQSPMHTPVSRLADRSRDCSLWTMVDMSEAVRGPVSPQPLTARLLGSVKVVAVLAVELVEDEVLLLLPLALLLLLEPSAAVSPLTEAVTPPEGPVAGASAVMVLLLLAHANSRSTRKKWAYAGWGVVHSMLQAQAADVKGM